MICLVKFSSYYKTLIHSLSFALVIICCRYWLPSLLKYKFVALRFVSQDAYERAAPLDVSPEPDIIQRVFMLFKGIDASLTSGRDIPGEWFQAEERAKLDADWWREVVGLQGECGVLMDDDSLFRVLEWGGMEVLSKRGVMLQG